jgi:flagellin-like hook-associated protein FlgL
LAEITGISGAPSLTAAASLRLGLAGEARNADFVRRSATISAAAARTIVDNSESAARSISAILEEVRSIVVYARNEGLLNGEFTRTARQTQVNLLLAEVDRIVEGNAVDDINLLSANAPITAFQTSALGGSFEISPKPLDRSSLRLTNLAIIDDGDLEIALSRLDAAITSATVKTRQLDGLGLVFSAGTSLLSQTATASANRVNLFA